MNVFELAAVLLLNKKDYDQGLKDAEKEASSFGSKLKSTMATTGKVVTGVLGTIGKATATTMAAAGAAVTKIGKQALDAYANYEQLVGGVETLFGNSFDKFAKNASSSMYKLGQKGEEVKKLQQELIKAGYDVGKAGADGIYGPATQKAFDEYAKAGGKLVKDAYKNMEDASKIVQENAWRAWKTAGLNANDYMELTTSFSASLLQSVGGDTEKAAKIADQAIIDMSDNANKMGTDMSSITTAYQGFAKQNYTMLDNLKLGYGGTKSEMERLIEDAEKLDKNFKATRDENKKLTLSYSDIIEAIHIVQTDLDITGTTAKEASTTISGSLASMKASWQNLLVGIGDDTLPFGDLVDNFVESVDTVSDNIMPRVEKILEGIANLVERLAPKIIEKLPAMAEKILPGLLKATRSLGDAVWRLLPGLIDKVVKFLSDNAGTLVAGFLQLVNKVVSKFNVIIKPILKALPKIIKDVAKAIADNAPAIIDGVIDLILMLVQELPTILLAIAQALPDILSGIFHGLIENLPELIAGVVELVDGLIKALPEILAGIVTAFGNLVADLVDAITPFGDEFKKIFNGFDLVGFIGGVLEEALAVAKGIFSFFSTLMDDPAEALKMAFNGVKDYAIKVFESLKDIVVGIFELIEAKKAAQEAAERRESIDKEVAKKIEEGWIFERDEEGVWQNKGAREGTEAAEILSRATADAPKQEVDVNIGGTVHHEGVNDKGEFIGSVDRVEQSLTEQLREQYRLGIGG